MTEREFSPSIAEIPREVSNPPTIVDLAKLVTNISLTQFLSPIAAVLFMLNSDHAVIPHNLKHGVLIMSMSGLSRILLIKPPMELLS